MLATSAPGRNGPLQILAHPPVASQNKQQQQKRPIACPGEKGNASDQASKWDKTVCFSSLEGPQKLVACGSTVEDPQVVGEWISQDRGVESIECSATVHQIGLLLSRAAVFKLPPLANPRNKTPAPTLSFAVLPLDSADKQTCFCVCVQNHNVLCVRQTTINLLVTQVQEQLDVFCACACVDVCPMRSSWSLQRPAFPTASFRQPQARCLGISKNLNRHLAANKTWLLSAPLLKV